MRFGAFVMTKARQSVRKKKKISEPGDPPSGHSELLKRLIRFAASNTSVIIGPERESGKIGFAPRALEYGGETEIKIKQKVGRKGKEQVKQLGKKITIKARPFMGPAFIAELKNLDSLWKNAISRR